jgi:hypothetical protein
MEIVPMAAYIVSGNDLENIVKTAQAVNEAKEASEATRDEVAQKVENVLNAVNDLGTKQTEFETVTSQVQTDVTEAVSKAASHAADAKLYADTVKVGITRLGGFVDSSGDDTVALQAALDSDHSVIHLDLNKTYDCSGIRLNSGRKKIIGSLSTKILQKAGSTIPLISIAPAATLDMELVNLSGNKASQTMELDAIHYDDGPSGSYRGSGKVHGCTITDFGGTGIYVGSTRHMASIKDNRGIFRCKVGIKTNGADQMIMDNDIGDCGQYGIWINGSANLISNANIYRCGESGLNVDRDCYYFWLRGCSFDTNSKVGLRYVGYAKPSCNYQPMITGTKFFGNSSSEKGVYPHVYFENIGGGSFDGCSFFHYGESTGIGGLPSYVIETKNSSNIMMIGSIYTDKDYMSGFTNDPSKLIIFDDKQFFSIYLYLFFGGFCLIGDNIFINISKT